MEQTKLRVIIMLGAPGAGKGTQATRLSQKLSIPQISTGDLFRENLRNATPIGKKAKRYMDKGRLVPDEVVLTMLFERLKKPDCQNGYILDGVPRTLHQAEALAKHFNKSVSISALSLEVPDSHILDRITGRLSCPNCGAIFHKTAVPPKVDGVCDHCGTTLVQRKDDTEAVVKERLAIFHKSAEPLKEYYKERKALIQVDGGQSKEATQTQIDAALKI